MCIDSFSCTRKSNKQSAQGASCRLTGIGETVAFPSACIVCLWSQAAALGQITKEFDCKIVGTVELVDNDVCFENLVVCGPRQVRNVPYEYGIGPQQLA